MKLCVKTKADSPVNGKQFLLLHSMPEDADVRDIVINMILNSENGSNYAVWYFEDKEKPPLPNGKSGLKSDCQIFGQIGVCVGFQKVYFFFTTKIKNLILHISNEVF